MVQDDPGYCSLAKGPASTEASGVQAAPAASATTPQTRRVSVPDRRSRAVVALAPMAVVLTPESFALPSAAGAAAANPPGFDRAALLPELENQVAQFFADPWR